MVLFLLSLVLLPLSVYSAAHQDRPCLDLSACASSKCLNKKHIMSSVQNSSSVDVFEKVVTSFDMICITTKCTNECTKCKSCEYAIHQMTALASGDSTGGMCPRLEGCIKKCIAGDDLPKILKCVNDDCNIHCYDGDCPSCRQLSKRIFTRFCRETEMISMPVFSSFQGTCPSLFEKLSVDFVTMKKKKGTH